MELALPLVAVEEQPVYLHCAGQLGRVVLVALVVHHRNTEPGEADFGRVVVARMPVAVVRVGEELDHIVVVVALVVRHRNTEPGEEDFGRVVVARTPVAAVRVGEGLDHIVVVVPVPEAFFLPWVAEEVVVVRMRVAEEAVVVRMRVAAGLVEKEPGHIVGD